MRRSIFRLAVVTSFGFFLLRSAAGCSSSSSSGSGGNSGDLCAFARASDSCWRTTIAAIDGCIGTNTTNGKLSADGKTCTSTDAKVVVTFTSPVDLTKPYDQRTRDFTLAVAGKTCLTMHQENGAKNMHIVGPDGKGLDVAVSGSSETVTCSDGKSYGGDATAFLTSCADQLLGGGLPGISDSGSATSDSLHLFSGKNPGYDCTQ